MKLRTLFIGIVIGLCLAGSVRGQSGFVQIKHDSAVQAVAWSYDGKLLASGGQDGMIVLTGMPSGKEVRRFAIQEKIRKGTLHSLAFSPDGKQLGVAVDGGLVTFSLWEVDTGQHLKSSGLAPATPLPQIAFRDDGLTLSVAGAGAVEWWQPARNSTSRRTFQRPKGHCFPAVAPNGEVMAFGQPDGNIQFYAMDGRGPFTLNAGPATAMAFASDAKMLAVAQADNTIRFFDIKILQPGKTLQGLPSPAAHLGFSRNGKVFAAVDSRNHMVHVWDVAGWQLQRRWLSPVQIAGLALSPDGQALAIAGGQHARVLSTAPRDLGKLGPPVELTAEEMETLWTRLDNTDFAAADKAFRRLAAGRTSAIPFLEAKIRQVAVPKLDHEDIQRLLADLDSDNFRTRQSAAAQLLKLDQVAAMYLQKLLAKPPSLEASLRARELLDKLKEPGIPPEQRRALQALELLEALGTPPARQVLQKLVGDAMILRIRQEAYAALLRLDFERGAAANDN